MRAGPVHKEQVALEKVQSHKPFQTTLQEKDFEMDVLRLDSLCKFLPN